MIFSSDWFINITCSLVLSLSIFIFLKYQRQTSGGCSRELACDFMNANVIYFLRTGVGMRIEKSIFQCVPTALCIALGITDRPCPTYVTRLGVKVQKWLININVYALRRVRCAGYATETNRLSLQIIASKVDWLQLVNKWFIVFINTLSFKQVTSCSMHSIVTTFRGADIKVEVANFCAAIDTLIDQDAVLVARGLVGLGDPGYTSDALFPVVNIFLYSL